MIKYFFVIILVISSTFFSFAASNSYTYLKSPIVIKPGQFTFGLLHRFYGDMHSTKSLGMYDGAKFGLDATVALTDKRKFAFSFDSQNSEMTFGVSQHLFEYNHFINAFQVDYYLYDRQNSYSGFMFLYFLQYKNPKYKFTPILNYYYSNDTEISNIAIGIEYEVLDNMTLEYEHVFSNDSLYDDDTYVYGIKFATFGLNFDLTVQNSRETGLHQVLNGVQDTGNTYFGIKVGRLFDIANFRSKGQYRQDYERFLREAQD